MGIVSTSAQASESVQTASGLTDNERLAAGRQVARIIHRLTALLFLIMAIPFVVVQLIHIRNWAIWPENSWSPAAFFDGIKGLWINYVHARHIQMISMLAVDLRRAIRMLSNTKTSNTNDVKK